MRISTSLAFSASVATVLADVARPAASHDVKKADQTDQHQMVVGLGNETWVYSREPKGEQFVEINGDDVLQYHVIPNIRYAVAPLGDRRFSKPSSVGNVWSNLPTEGWDERACTQARVPSRTPQTIHEPSVSGTEDCLFLDVYAPARGFDLNGTHKYPVTVFFHDGDFIAGSKADVEATELMLEALRSDPASNSGTVLVSFNYRLGLFGWLPQTADYTDRVSNLGLWDQQFALRWVKQHIGLFHGDPNHVTVVGEGTGAGSIMHHLTGWDGRRTPDFQRAILHNPRWYPHTDNIASVWTRRGSNFITGRLVDSVDDLAKLSSEELSWLNKMMLEEDPSLFGPIRDDSFVHNHPLSLFKQQGLPTPVEIIVGNNDASDFLHGSLDTSLNTYFPLLTQGDKDHVKDSLYALDLQDRERAILHEGLIACNSLALAEANPEAVRKYLYNSTVSGSRPGIHVWQSNKDNGDTIDGVQNESNPKTLLVKFLTWGNMSDTWQPYGDGKQTLSFSHDGALPINEQEKGDESCKFWNGGLNAYDEEERGVRPVFIKPRDFGGRYGYRGAASSLQGKSASVAFVAALIVVIVSL